MLSRQPALSCTLKGARFFPKQSVDTMRSLQLSSLLVSGSVVCPCFSCFQLRPSLAPSFAIFTSILCVFCARPLGVLLHPLACPGPRLSRAILSLHVWSALDVCVKGMQGQGRRGKRTPLALLNRRLRQKKQGGQGPCGEGASDGCGTGSSH